MTPNPTQSRDLSCRNLVLPIADRPGSEGHGINVWGSSPRPHSSPNHVGHSAAGCLADLHKRHRRLPTCKGQLLAPVVTDLGISVDVPIGPARYSLIWSKPVLIRFRGWIFRAVR